MPTTPSQWLTVLDKRLEARRKNVELCERYYAGDHRLAFATSRFRETFGALFKAIADNWCQLVVDASVERLAIEGFRFGSDDADRDAWEMWQANEMDAQSMLGFTEAVKCGESYLLVADDDGEPLITVEHPSQCIVAYAPGMRRRRLAAMKKWLDDDGYVRANVWDADVIVKFRSESRWKEGGDSSRIAWRTMEAESGEHTLGAVPMVPLLNEPSMLGGGTSDIKPIIPEQDAVNKLFADMLVASEFAAFRQRWATGIEIPLDPDTGQPMDPKKYASTFLSGAGRVWAVADENVQFGEFSASDLGNYVKAIEMLVQHIAAQTRTPPHYLLGQSGAFPSGESLKSTETGLVAKVRRKMLTFGEGCEEAMRLGFRIRGDDEKAQLVRAETLWRDPESRTTGEQTDAALKEIAAGVPRQMVWRRRFGMSPQEVEEARAMVMQDALERMLDTEEQRERAATALAPPAV